MNTIEFEIAKLNRNMIRLAEFLTNIKKENVSIPKTLVPNVNYFLKHSYGVDTEDVQYIRMIYNYHEHIKNSLNKMKGIDVDDANKLNAKIFTNILNETDFSISIFLKEHQMNVA